MAHREQLATPERSALLASLWPDRSIPTDEILRLMNQLEGPRIAGPISLYPMAARLGFSLVRFPQGHTVGRARISLPHPDRAEAERLFATGRNVRQVACELGLEDQLGNVSDWFFAWRTTHAAQQVAA
ncbi:hypothetical protein [Roseomonas xinghualingensis]|uniref:hypothetical protein n=1 Tax=Roseomonas xinghualingensis TaxID=2986475 RepID=UPI0021F21871|nr:hypothetical protein [Roseomonas sp. SXEYE001]MCV4206889.1 hypothetical protein [Roseomonas sp. SXEYE001]